MKRLLFAALLVAGLAGHTGHGHADDLLAAKPNAKMGDHAKVVALYGNSYSHYNNHLNTRLRDLTRSLLPNKAKGYSYRGLSSSSAYLGWHKPSLEFQNGLKHWDAVIFQGNSMEPIHKDHAVRQAFETSAQAMSKIAHAAGSKVVYFMTWARKAQPEQTVALEKAYFDIASKTGGYMAPVGLAFAKSMQLHPDIDLYFVDGKHPSLEGTYLAACVFFAILHDQSPVGGAVPIGSDMAPGTAKKLQQVAWDVVQEFRSAP